MLSRRGVGGGLLLALALAGLSAAPALAEGDGRCVDGFCEFEGKEPGQPVVPGIPEDPGGGGERPIVDPVDDPDFCAQWEGTGMQWRSPYSCEAPYDPSLDCVWGMMSPQPGLPAGKEEGDGAWYECGSGLGGALAGGETRWFDFAQAGSDVDPEVAARTVVAQMQLEGVEMGMVPRSTEDFPKAMGAVGLPAWFWVADTGNAKAWGPHKVTRSVEGLEVTATARPRSVTWNTGDGGSVECLSAGTPYEERFGREESPDCGHVYEQMGRYTVTAMTNWEVEWSADGASGVIETTTQSTAPVTIGELRAVNVTPPNG